MSPSNGLFCALLMGAAGLVMGLRPAPRAARIAWLILLGLGVAHALALNLRPTTLVGANMVHHYLGAKYPVPYDDFYEVVTAAAGRPQVDFRDLSHPSRMVASDPRERRAYFIDLMRARGVSFDRLAPTDELARRALESGAVAAEAESILRRHLPEARVADLRRDVSAAEAAIHGTPLTHDYGYNGSPFYSLTRRIDPTLLRPFGAGVAILSVLAQIAAAFVLVWILGAALELSREERWAATALLFASWDFAAYSLSGLVFAELWLPVGLAALAARQRRGAPAGVAIAWAGLIKLFPLILTLPALVRVAVPVSRPSSASPAPEVRAWCLRLLATCALATLVLGSVALISGRSWDGFVRKILAEFQTESSLANNVSLSAGLLTLGIPPTSLLLWALSLFTLVVLAMMFRAPRDAEFLASLPRRWLVLVAATGWAVRTWLNYYVVAPLVLLPLFARRHPRASAAAALGMALSFVLPDFNDPALIARPWLRALKLLPYLAVPAWMVWLELRVAAPRAARVVAMVACGLALAAAGEGWRMSTIRSLRNESQFSLDTGDVAGAIECGRTLVRLSPFDGRDRMSLAIALATAGRMQEARNAFARAAELAPDSPAVQDNYGRALMMEGRLEEAASRIEAARRLSPADPQILFTLASIRSAQGRTTEAVDLLQRARELEPREPAIIEALRSIGVHEPMRAG